MVVDGSISESVRKCEIKMERVILLVIELGKLHFCIAPLQPALVLNSTKESTLFRYGLRSFPFFLLGVGVEMREQTTLSDSWVSDK